MLKGYIPLNIKSSLTTMPADFLIDREGNIQAVYYGKDKALFKSLKIKLHDLN